MVDQMDVTKSRGPNGLPLAFFMNTSRENRKNLVKVFKNIKRSGEFPDSWKRAAVTPIHRKGVRRKVGNYRPVSPLDIESKVLEKSIYTALYKYFTFYIGKHQPGFVRHRSVFTNIFYSLKKIHECWTTT